MKILCNKQFYDAGEKLKESVLKKELSEIKDIEKAKEICKACPYSDLGGGLDEWDGNLD